MKIGTVFLLLLTVFRAFAAEPAAPSADRYSTGDPAGVVFQVTIEDPANLLGGIEGVFRENFLAAAELWSERLSGKARIEVLVKLKPGAGRAVTRCPRMSFLKKIGKNSLFEPSAVAKVRTGAAETGGQPDIEMTIHGDYLPRLWFDPRPRERTGAPAPDRLDAVSLFLHEIAHGLGFNGWIDPRKGELEGGDVSTFDRYVVFEQGEFSFVGLRAMNVHGGPVRLSRRNNNYHHLGREEADCPVELKGDLMNGVLFVVGRRYSISALDLAILEDCGMPTKASAR